MFVFCLDWELLVNPHNYFLQIYLLHYLPVGTRKIDTIQFLNDAILGTKIQLKLEKKMI
jgi:hypothetical protein